MAQQVGKGYTINLTASQRAGTKALEELRSQGHISTTNWHQLTSGSIDDSLVNNPIGRNLIFILENEQRVEVRVFMWRQMSSVGHVIDNDEPHKWYPGHIYVEKGSMMLAFENHLNGKKYGGEPYPWTRNDPKFDKPVPSATT